MEPGWVLYTLALLCIFPLITSHLITGKATCDDTSTTLICSDDCRYVLRCPSGATVYNCTGLSVPYCHQPATGGASCSHAPRCLGAPLGCRGEGVFPDPYYCTIYHQCSTDFQYSQPIDCGDTAYNIATGSCDLPLDAPVCLQGPVPECMYWEEFGVLPDNKQYYYRCRRDGNGFFFPDMYKCPDGQHFDENSGLSGSCSVVTTTVSTTLPTEATTTTTATSPSTKTYLPTESTTTTSTIKRHL